MKKSRMRTMWCLLSRSPLVLRNCRTSTRACKKKLLLLYQLGEESPPLRQSLNCMRLCSRCRSSVIALYPGSGPEGLK